MSSQRGYQATSVDVGIQTVMSTPGHPVARLDSWKNDHVCINDDRSRPSQFTTCQWLSPHQFCNKRDCTVHFGIPQYTTSYFDYQTGYHPSYLPCINQGPTLANEGNNKAGHHSLVQVDEDKQHSKAEKANHASQVQDANQHHANASVTTPSQPNNNHWAGIDELLRENFSSRYGYSSCCPLDNGNLVIKSPHNGQVYLASRNKCGCIIYTPLWKGRA